MNNTVLERADIQTIFSLLKQRRMRWLGNVCWMEDGRTPTGLLYGELVTEKRLADRTPTTAAQEHAISKHDLKALGINSNTWETAAADRSTWKQEVKKGLSFFGENQS